MWKNGEALLRCRAKERSVETEEGDRWSILPAPVGESQPSVTSVSSLSCATGSWRSSRKGECDLGNRDLQEAPGGR